MTKCPDCGRATLRTVNEPQTRSVAGRTFMAFLPTSKCSGRGCGASYYDGAVGIRFDLAIAAELVRLGASEGEAFKHMRKAVGLKNTDMADLLDVDAVTLSRWETGKHPVPRAELATLGAIVAEAVLGSKATLDRLRKLQKPSARSRRPVRLELAAGR